MSISFLGEHPTIETDRLRIREISSADAARRTRQEIVRIKTDFAEDDFARTRPFEDPSAPAGLVADLREADLP